MHRDHLSVSASTILGVMLLFGGKTLAQQAPAAAAATPVPPQVAYISHGDMDAIWKNLEATNTINKRVVEGGKYSVNIRTIRETDAPMTHSNSVDIWVMEEGSAVAITGGTLLNPTKKPKVDDVIGTAIEGGKEQLFLPGDVLYVPAGVPHGFKDVKGFRAYLIRIDLQ